MNATLAPDTASVAEAGGPPPRLRARLLVVDDEAAARAAVVRVLRQAGYDVLEAALAEEGLRLAREGSPDLVLMDVNLPDMSGVEAARLIKADPALDGMFVINLSANMTSPEDQAQGLDAGADGYIARPIGNRELLARVKAFLRLKQVTDALRRSEGEQRRLAEVLNAVIDALPAHIALLDERGVITSVNAAWRRFGAANGLQQPAFGVGQNYPGLCDSVEGSRGGEAAEAAAGIRAVLAGDEQQASIEYPCHSPTEQRWYRMQVTPLRAPSAAAAGTAGGAVVMHVDIGERKRTELATLLEQSDALILVLDGHGRIEAANPAFISATGFSPLEPDPLLQARWQGPLPLHRSVRVRAEQARRDGSSFSAEWTVAPIFDRDARLISHVCIGRDVTREQQIQEGLRENDKLRATATLAGAFAHDFNNLLGSVIGLTELCALEAPAGSQLATNLSRIGQASDRAAALVRQLLDFSRQTPKLTQRMWVGELLAHADGLLRAALPAQVTLKVAIDADAPVSIDLVQWEQVLLNLTRNAAHAMRGRGGEIRITVDLAEPAASASASASALAYAPAYPPASVSPGPVRLRVSDDGEGMAPALLARIFDPFFTTKPVGEGTGLGLAAVQGIVSSHGGSIEVASQPGVGTTFSLYLPCDVVATDHASGAGRAGHAGHAGHAGQGRPEDRFVVSTTACASIGS